jgi:hypothetical protein
MSRLPSALLDAKDRVPGLRATSFGDGDTCPTAHVAAPLRAVS